MRIICTILIIAFFVGCANKEIDIALQQADSLIINHSDQAYDILKSINPSDLRGTEQSANYALLYTQAQHKNVDSISSDSLINVAVEYFQERDRRKFTLSLMYKGAALSDMGIKREAMEWYKRAEELCDSSDYLTLGLINSRIGELYQDMFVVNDEDYQRFKKSLGYYVKLNDSMRMSFCMEKLGQLSILRNSDTAYFYIYQALDIARKRNDLYGIIYAQILLSKTLYYNKEYEKSKNLAINVIKISSSNGLQQEAYLCAIKAYANLGYIDSAQYYLNRLDNIDRMKYYMCLTEIEKALNNYKEAFIYSEKSNKIADSIYERAQSVDLYRFEKLFDKSQVDLKNKELQSKNIISNYIILSCVLCIILVCTLFYFIIKHKQTLNDSNLLLIERLQKQSINSQNTIISKLETESKLKQALENQITAIKELIELSYRNGGNPEKFMEKFKDSVKINKLSEGLWKDLRYVVNEKYDGFIDSLHKKYPKLNNEDLNFISLMCCGFSYLEITVCLGYTNERSTCNKRVRLARKMGITTPLEVFINEHIKAK